MSNTLKVTLGVDLSAYATVDLPGDSDLTEEGLAKLATEFAESDAVLWEPDWDASNGLRIVHVRDDKHQPVREQVQVDRSYYDAGQALECFVKGTDNGGGVATLVNAAAEAKLILAPKETATYVAHVVTPSGRFFIRNIRVRKGATRDELDLAFLNAFREVGSISYAPAATPVAA